MYLEQDEGHISTVSRRMSKLGEQFFGVGRISQIIGRSISGADWF